MFSPRALNFPRKYLLQAPFGIALKLTRRSDHMVRQRVAGKHIAIVGNAQSLLQKQHGAEIDAADIVLRLNKGFVVKPLAQGTRTDILGLSVDYTSAEVDELFNADFIIWLTPKLRHFRLKAWHHLRKTAFYRHWYFFRDRNLLGRRPSSGFMITSYLLRLDCAASITLYGFDFGATDTFYNPEGYVTPHHYDAEERQMRAFEQAARIIIR